MSYVNFDLPLVDTELDSQAFYLATKLGEVRLIPKYRYVVINYSREKWEMAMDYAQELFEKKKIKTSKAAAFWWMLEHEEQLRNTK